MPTSMALERLSIGLAPIGPTRLLHIPNSERLISYLDNDELHVGRPRPTALSAKCLPNYQNVRSCSLIQPDQ